ncbi:UPF0029-domain-containing protein [Hesseltinella vesiculosa]|uniref:UPF0029-domain-containing protein n=1 Tax=Hesseltinella vesiculosa TaxID=101127 RepID=A0A1X2GDZ5_9FUNG|nr:UPF0029-domain-containing protein [Hesseltinella vesiculosa]
MEDNQSLQEEERMAVCAIYGDEVLVLDEQHSADDQQVYTLTTNIDEDEDVSKLSSLRILVMHLFFPATYPSTDKPVFEIMSKYCGPTKVDDAMVQAIQQSLDELFQPGNVVLFDWIQAVRDYIQDNIPLAIVQDIHADDGLSPASSAPPPASSTTTPTAMTMDPSKTLPKIYSSEPLMDRKSSFVAHVAEVHSAEQVDQVMSALLSNKKIAKATHNILAYRITLGGDRVLQDSDDDGETAAGGRLLHLLQILEVENVVVVVSRWFGGILLGADRFKDINNCARKALEDCGYIKDTAAVKKGKK